VIGQRSYVHFATASYAYQILLSNLGLRARHHNYLITKICITFTDQQKIDLNFIRKIPRFSVTVSRFSEGSRFVARATRNRLLPLL